MSEHIDTSDGTWREVNAMIGTPPHLIEYADNGDATRFWVRVEPVPPLPTEPYTVIRVTWKYPVDAANPVRLLREESGAWSYGTWTIGAKILAESITGFEVLASPGRRTDAEWKSMEMDFNDLTAKVRRETAKAVLDRVKPLFDQFEGAQRAFEMIAREFGVSDKPVTVKAEDDDEYYDSDDMSFEKEQAYRAGAKAALARLLELNDGEDVLLYTIVAREFGVDDNHPKS